MAHQLPSLVRATIPSPACASASATRIIKKLYPVRCPIQAKTIPRPFFGAVDRLPGWLVPSGHRFDPAVLPIFVKACRDWLRHFRTPGSCFAQRMECPSLPPIFLDCDGDGGGGDKGGRWGTRDGGDFRGRLGRVMSSTSAAELHFVGRALLLEFSSFLLRVSPG